MALTPRGHAVRDALAAVQDEARRADNDLLIGLDPDIVLKRLTLAIDRAVSQLGLESSR
jgi:predicted ATP-grasp superfamily ATP-dependent carboligase